MKTSIRALSATLLLVATGVLAGSEAERDLSNAKSRYDKAQSIIRADFRKDLAAALAKGDGVVVYLLDFETEDTPSGFWLWENGLEEDEFPIIPYGKKSKILKKATLTAEQKLKFIPKLQEVVGVQGEVDGGAFCHYPIHGVRVYAGETIIFQSSFCWACTNFAISYPDGPAWIAIREAGLFEAFSELMPIPQSELDRFNAKSGPKPEATKTKAKQPGTVQPATRPEPKSQGSDKPQPESEERSR